MILKDNSYQPNPATSNAAGMLKVRHGDNLAITECGNESL